MEHNKNSLSPDGETATLAGGCFWCLEAVYQEVKGVDKVISGYTGGLPRNPSYSEVSSGTTGHAEAVQIFFQPEEISYEDLLRIFFTIHDPTTLNRQGADVGTQYRSAIFYHNDKQKNIAEEIIRNIETSKIWEHPIVTEVTAFTDFYPAEQYHQDYYKHNSDAAYCRLIIEPKVTKFRQRFMNALKKE